ncbi:hypothetical protein ACQ3G7_07830 [Kosakonia oryzendophytica]|uniref:hypothetical protein n=1 Tax=Kosakonia oryzendophytica TaxID=1005665 RepID=UPI003D3331D2
MKYSQACYVDTFFDGFVWHQGGWCIRQNNEGHYNISAEPKARGCRVLALAPLINMHAHLLHVPRYNHLSGVSVLESKPNIGHDSFNERILGSTQNSALHGVNIVCSSIRPEDVGEFIHIYNDLPIYVIPFLSIKQYHERDLIIQRLQELQDFFTKKNIPIRPALLIHSLYNINEKSMHYYSRYAMENNFVLSIHFFEWPGERDFYNNPGDDKEDEIFSRMKANWPKETLSKYLENFFLNNKLMRILIHCNYLPYQLSYANHDLNNLIVFCPASCVRLRNNVAMPENLSGIAFATDGYFTNMGYDLFTEIKTYNIVSQVNNRSYHPDKMLSGITGNPASYMLRLGLVLDRKFIYNFRNINFYYKKSGCIPPENTGFDLLNYHDNYDRYNIYG